MLVSRTNARPRTSIHVHPNRTKNNNNHRNDSDDENSLNSIRFIHNNNKILLSATECIYIDKRYCWCCVAIVPDFRCGKRKMNEKFRETVDVRVLTAAVVGVAARWRHNCIKMRIIMCSLSSAAGCPIVSVNVYTCMSHGVTLSTMLHSQSTHTHTHICSTISIPVHRFHPYGNSKTKDVKINWQFPCIGWKFFGCHPKLI